MSSGKILAWATFAVYNPIEPIKITPIQTVVKTPEPKLLKNPGQSAFSVVVPSSSAFFSSIILVYNKYILNFMK